MFSFCQDHAGNLIAARGMHRTRISRISRECTVKGVTGT